MLHAVLYWTRLRQRCSPAVGGVDALTVFFDHLVGRIGIRRGRDCEGEVHNNNDDDNYYYYHYDDDDSEFLKNIFNFEKFLESILI